MKVRVSFLLSIAGFLFGMAALAHAEGTILKVDYPASTETSELKLAVTYSLWIPDGVQTLRGIIVHQHGASIPAAEAGDTAAYDLHWQALAQKWDCALLGPSYHVLNNAIDDSPGGAELWFDPLRGSDKAFLKALSDLAAKTGHPEIATVPWALWGHSGGGIWADVMTTLHPERVIAVWLRSGSAAMFRDKPEFPQPKNIPEALYAIPMMANPGVNEKGKAPWSGTLATFHEYRAKGGLIGFAPDPISAHWCGDSRYLAIPFLDACLAARLPEKGSRDQKLKPMQTDGAWLAEPLSERAVSAADFKGKAEEAVWLPNEAVAKIWMEYVKNGTVGDSTPPPAPFAVKAASSAEGNEISWDARADFESGVGAFIVMRDARGLARLPSGPPPRIFGRPLFQGLSYHDTPEGPSPPMRFVDATANPEDKHTYTVIEINSAGVASKPSESIIVNPEGKAPAVASPSAQ